MFLGTFIGIDGDQMKYVQETVNKFMEKL